MDEFTLATEQEIALIFALSNLEKSGKENSDSYKALKKLHKEIYKRFERLLDEKEKRGIGDGPNVKEKLVVIDFNKAMFEYGEYYTFKKSDCKPFEK